MTKKDIGDIIKKKRKQKNKSSYAVAKEVNVMPNQLSSIENASSNYTIDSLLAVAECLDLQLNCKNK